MENKERFCAHFYFALAGIGGVICKTLYWLISHGGDDDIYMNIDEYALGVRNKSRAKQSNAIPCAFCFNSTHLICKNDFLALEAAAIRSSGEHVSDCTDGSAARNTQ